MEGHLQSQFQDGETGDPQARRLASYDNHRVNSGFSEGTLTRYFWWTDIEEDI